MGQLFGKILFFISLIRLNIGQILKKIYWLFKITFLSAVKYDYALIHIQNKKITYGEVD